MVVAENRSFLLPVIRLLHTLSWLLYALVLAYIFYAVTVDRMDGFLWWCVVLILLEEVVLAANKGKCLLTLLAARYSPGQAAGFTIFMPGWPGGYTKKNFTNLFLIELGILACRLLEKYGFAVTS